MEEPINNSLNEEKKKKKKGTIKYFISIGLVLVLTAVSLLMSFSAADSSGDIVKGAVNIWNGIAGANIYWLLATFAVAFIAYALDGVILLVFCRLYTRHYKWHQGFANALIGAFYSAVTPGASGGQVMQVYTLKKQGIEVSNGASIMVMWFILYQTNLIVFDIISIAVEWQTVMSLQSLPFSWDLWGWKGSITLLPLIVIGFVINLGALALLFLMSYSHRFHNFIMHYIVNFLAKIKIIKNPDKSRENLRVQVENFKIELRRLQSNVPVTLLLSIFFMTNFFIRYSIPYFSGFSLGAVGDFSFMKMLDTCFLSAFHQMVTGIFPIPGAAGVSELFFNSIYANLIGATYDSTGTLIRTASANMAAAQIIWRSATFHIVVIVSGLVSALYKGKPHEDYHYANRQTFVNLQLETFEIRKLSADTLYETHQLSRKEIQKKLHNWKSAPTKKKPTKSDSKRKK